MLLLLLLVLVAVAVVLYLRQDNDIFQSLKGKVEILKTYQVDYSNYF